MTSTVLDAILKASSPYEMLGLSADDAANGVSASAVRHAFRKRALVIHPDKCNDERAGAAFQMLSDSLEQLSSATLAPQGTPSSSGMHHQKSTGTATKRRRTSDGRESRRSWAEWERELARRDELERCFQRMQCDQYAQRRTANVLLKVCNVCDELDERAGITDNALLLRAELEDAAPGSPLPPLLGASSDARADSARLLSLLLYLRERHLYCYFCCARYGDSGELQSVCPGVLEADHEEDGGGRVGACGGVDEGSCSGEYDY